MTKYIDADALKEAFLIEGKDVCDATDEFAAMWGASQELIEKVIDSAPAADVEPKRKTGTWTEENVYFDSYAWRCSVCKEDWNLIEGTPFENNMRFCPKCGAEMIAEVPKGEEDAEVH